MTMRFFDFTPQKTEKIAELKKRVDDADEVRRMAETAGWKKLSALLEEQLEAYKLDTLMGCKNWDEYLDKRSKAWAINLLLTDVDDYIRMGEEAEEELDQMST